MPANLALLRRLAGAPVPAENFMHADIRPENLSASQPGVDRAEDRVAAGPATAIAWPSTLVVGARSPQTTDRHCLIGIGESRPIFGQ